MVGPIVSHTRAIVRVIFARVHRVWKQYRALRPRYQIIIGVVVAALLIGLVVLLGSGPKSASVPQLRSVTLLSVNELSGNGLGASVIGTVRSVTEADILAEAGGNVQSVNTRIGTSVPAGYVIAELENAAQRAAVLQAEGAYDAAVASRASVSPVDAQTAASNAYRAAFTSLDSTLQNYVDTFFGAPTPTGPNLLINPAGSDASALSRERAEITRIMDTWSENLARENPEELDFLLADAESITRGVQTFIETLAVSANANDSRATSEQLAALAIARTNVSAVLSSLANARATYRSGSTSSTASVDAGVKSALGTLRLAQSNLEKTVIRAPIAGTINFLPIRVGEYVMGLQHVATVAQNGALEIITYVSEEERSLLEVGASVGVEEGAGVITSISPALDPITRQIEVRIAVAKEEIGLVNGQTIRITLPGLASTASEGPVMLPLSSVKLSAGARVVFTAIAGELVAVPVEIGEVYGERIEILSPLSPELRIVSDARGLAEGQSVNITGE